MKTTLAKYILFSLLSQSLGNEWRPMKLITGVAQHSRILSSPSRLPAPFHGPAEMHLLYGLCFEYTDEQHFYSFCPFINLTQVAFDSTEAPTLIGLWGEWTETGAMVLTDGDTCGEGKRRAIVAFKCRNDTNRSELVLVEEPKTCMYSAEFLTKLVCGDFQPYSFVDRIGRYLMKTVKVIQGFVEFPFALTDRSFVEDCLAVVDENKRLREKLQRLD